MESVHVLTNFYWTGASGYRRIATDTFQSSGFGRNQTWNQCSQVCFKTAIAYNISPSKFDLPIYRQLRHENVIRFIGVCTHPQHLCIITELCAKGDLFDVIRNYKKPNFSQLVSRKLLKIDTRIDDLIMLFFFIKGHVHVWHCIRRVLSTYKKVSFELCPSIQAS